LAAPLAAEAAPRRNCHIFPMEKVEFFSQSFETICRAGMSPFSRPLFMLLVHTKLRAWVQRAGAGQLPVSRSSLLLCSVGTDLFLSFRPFNCPTSSFNPRALLLHSHLKTVAALSDLNCGLYVQKCVGSSSSINATEETVSSWNLSQPPQLQECHC